jgi:hypothetical protein
LTEQLEGIKITNNSELAFKVLSIETIRRLSKDINYIKSFLFIIFKQVQRRNQLAVDLNKCVTALSACSKRWNSVLINVCPELKRATISKVILR